MKLALTLLLSLLTLSSFAQKVRYLNENFIQVNFKDQATFYTETYPDGPQAGTVKTYTLQGILLSEETFSNINRKIRNGVSRTYFPDGKLRSEITFKDGFFHGPLRTFYPTQRLKRAELYENGVSVQGKCFSKAGYDSTFYAFQQAPHFPGGGMVLDKYLTNVSRFPLVPVSDDLIRKGFVKYSVVKFAISTTGKISDVMMYRSLGAFYDREVVRILNTMPNWIPAQQDGENVASHHTLTFGFR